MTDKTETIENQAEQTAPPSDTKILLAPLGRYAVIGAFIVAVIVTTAIMLDNQLNNIDREMASLQTELANANQQLLDAITGNADTQEVPVIEVTAIDDAGEVINIIQPVTSGTTASATPATQAPAAASFTPPQRQAPIYTAPRAYFTAADNVNPAFQGSDDFIKARQTERESQKEQFIAEIQADQEQFIAESNEYLKQMDREYLDNFRAYQQRSLASMRDQLARQQQRIEEKEKRYQEIYDIRAANIERMQQEREEIFSERI
jgi:hypothetical protein